jgi:hypothetical protein
MHFPKLDEQSQISNVVETCETKWTFKIFGTMNYKMCRRITCWAKSTLEQTEKLLNDVKIYATTAKLSVN